MSNVGKGEGHCSISSIFPSYSIYKALFVASSHAIQHTVYMTSECRLWTHQAGMVKLWIVADYQLTRQAFLHGGHLHDTRLGWIMAWGVVLLLSIVDVFPLSFSLQTLF